MTESPDSIFKGDCLYRLVDMCPEGFVSEPKWRNRAYGTVICPNCKRIDRAHFPAPVDAAVLSAPRNISGGLVSMAGLGVRHRTIIEQLGAELEQLALGRLFDKHGEQLDEYVTCYGKDYIMIRGGGGPQRSKDICEGTKYLICWKCESVSPQLGQIPPYVLRRDLGRKDVYHNAFSSIYITLKLKNRIDWSPWPTICFERVDVRDEPLSDDPWPLYKKAYYELKAKSDGDMQAAIQEVANKVAMLKLPDSVQLVPVEIHGIKLQVEVWSSRGVINVLTMRAE